MPENQDEEVEIPAMVTFTTGAALLVELKIVSNMTREGIRKIANTDPTWPFGPGKTHDYQRIANAQAMDAEPFLEFFRARKVKGRGPGKKPPSSQQQGGPEMAVYTLTMRIEADREVTPEQIRQEIYDACPDVPFGFDITSIEGEQ